MEALLEFFKKEIIRRILFIIIFLTLIVIFFPMIDLLILSFLFSYLLSNVQATLEKVFNRFFKVHSIFFTFIIYLVMFLTAGIFLYKYLPIALKEGSEIINFASEFSLANSMPQNYFTRTLMDIFKPEDIEFYKEELFNKLIKFATDAGKWSANILIALILSLFFNLEKRRIFDFLRKFKDSKVGWAYGYCTYFGRSFLNSFGKVMNAQILIAIVNTVLSLLGLFLFGFPSLVALGFMIFILSLIPVAGVVISLIPLSLIAFKLGGIVKVLAVLIMVAVIHFIEGYFLNPKLMADKTELPMFMTFVVLIVSEHFLGIWGLLIGIPLFIFLLELADVRFGKKHEINITDNKIMGEL